MKKLNIVISALMLLASFGFGFRYFFHGGQSSNKATEALFAATFPDEKGQAQPISQYKGKTIVLNFWATWCEPCREEMPELSTLHEEGKNKNVIVLGVAVDDADAINDFTKETKVSYPLLVADMQGMDLANSLGNDKGVLPYTVIINADGSVAKTYFGRISKPLLEATLFKNR
jgi:thiol-disulfide isomerase/thioredoxin